VKHRVSELLGRALARITLPIMRRTQGGREFLAALNYYNDGGAAGVVQRELLKRRPLTPQKRWDAWTDKETGEAMLSRVDGDKVFVRPLHTIHEPGIMSKADFEARYGDSARKGKK
jgi:hypothetical protein